MSDETDVHDEDDHDLLTFNESGIRLRQEIRQIRQTLDADPDADSAAALGSRLAALEDSLARSSRTAEHSPGEKGFLDYEPPTHPQETDR